MNLSSLLLALNLKDFVAFDVETTGLNTKDDSIIELSAFRFIDGKQKKSFTTLINPLRPIPKFITELTGIKNSDVKNSPTIKDVLPSLLIFLNNSPIVGQNIGFDIEFLNNALIQSNLQPYKNSKVYDTSTLGRFCLFFHSDFSLSGISEYYNINTDNAHRAEADTLNTGLIFVELIREIAKNEIHIFELCNKVLNNDSIYNFYLFKNLLELSFKSNLDNDLEKKVSNWIPTNSIIKNENNEFNINNYKIEDILSENGFFDKKWENFEPRQNQINFSNDILSSFETNQILLGEAGTGLGKSFSYLTASAIYSLRNKIPIVISTYTKHLQDQLFNKDIPNFINITKFPISAVILKGRQNYICKTRLNQFIKYRLNKLNPKEKELFLPIIAWADKTKTGDIEECPAFSVNRSYNIWLNIRSEPGYCTTTRCKENDGCYYGKVRKSTTQANLIIINHALLSIELTRENSILPTNFCYVIDEGHNFIKSIRDQLTDKINPESIKDILNFYKFESSLFEDSILNSINKHAPEYIEHANEITIESVNIITLIDLFFYEFSNLSNKNGSLSNLHYEKNFLINKNSKIFHNLDNNPENILSELISFSKKVISLENSLKKNNEFPQSVLLEYSTKSNALENLKLIFTRIVHLLDEDIVWSSFKSKFGKLNCTLNTAPKDLGIFLRESLFNRDSGGVICSATLALNSSFSFIKESLGISNSNILEKLKTIEYSSPFYYEDQVELWAYDSLELVNSETFVEKISSQINELAKNYRNRILVLCTSYDQVKKIRDNIKPTYNKLEKKIFAQTIGHSRRAMIRGYSNTPESILIGTMSFWEGVDFPGDLVEILIIFKIPFDNPTDPILMNEIDNYKKKGMNAFIEYQIPTATVKFKQGFGRLIRSLNDNGICILTDPRLLKAQYGKLILDALPLKAIPYKDINEIKRNTKIFK